MRFCCWCVLCFSAYFAPTLDWSQTISTGSQAAAQEPGSQKWWANNRHRATFVPGKGNQVEGVDGFFDDDGRPIRGGAVIQNDTPYLAPGEGRTSWIDSLDPAVAYERMKDADESERRKVLSKIGTIDMRVDYVRPGKGEWFEATGRVLRTGNKVAVTRMEVHNDKDELIALGTGTYLCG